MKRKSQQGVALVITLILLSVITFMAVTFLVVSRKEASQVNTLTQQANAKFASEAGLEEAKAQIVAQMLTTGNGLNFGLLVSTNFISATNFDTVNNVTAFTNVTYAGLLNASLPQMLNNMIILPRVPVFIVTNKAAPNNLDFRYYLDLNRNGRYDTNGLVLNMDSNGIPIPSAVNPSFSVQVGDPEWVGILNHPDQRHSSSNLFVARYCFIALPIGNSLDVNFIHNQATEVNSSSTMTGGTEDGYMRNQGFGSWELNLAGFLNALNTNSWPTANYQYLTPSSFANKGEAFADAAAIVQYRYNKNLLNVGKFTDMFSAPGSINPAFQFENDFIDGFSVGPLMTNTFPLTFERDASQINGNKPWSGANNPNAFFTTQDFYGNIPAGSTLVSFTNHLHAPGLSRATYDRYTYYRMLSQMSFGSAPESSETFNAATTSPFPGYFPFTSRLNINYCNVGVTNATNFQAWDPLQFFTNAANRLLANAGYTNTVANIPIYPTNIYTPALHRLLQLAANIYDATTNRPFDTDPASSNLFYPSVFRPLFGTRVVNGIQNVYISGYTNDPPELLGIGLAAYNNAPYGLPEDLSTIVTKITATGTDPKLNIYGIPWVIGAKKGFPNFNEFSMASSSQITRKLQVVFNSQTNVQYTVGLSNVLGVEAWNSYASAYPRQVSILGVATLSVYLTNENGELLVATNRTIGNSMFFGKNPTITYNANSWPGFAHPTTPNADPNSFRMPLLTNMIALPDSVYHAASFPRFSIGGTNFDVTGTNFLPHLVLNYTNRLQFVMVDTATGRVIDYVSFGGLNFTRDLTGELQGTDGGGHGGVWLTNLQGGVPTGITRQLQISEGYSEPNFTSPSDWINDQLQATSETAAQTAFGNFMNGQGPGTVMQAPYTPTRKVAVSYTWQANDPLVHYTLGDLTLSPNIGQSVVTNYLTPALNTNQYLPNIGQVNQRYLPWKNTGNLKASAVDTTNRYNLAVKDPQIVNSDAWQFPTNKFPNVGWLGRVHRGTPWQTVYLKSQTVDSNNWQNWSGDMLTNQFSPIFTANAIYSPNFVDSTLSNPTNDWNIIDLFTTAANDNASRGQLSVNQTNLAAWAAVLDGVIVVSNSTAGQFPIFIDPATNLNAILQIVSGINSLRSTFLAPQGGVFTSVGQILAAPQLTVASPYLNLNPSLGQASPQYPTDAEFERIPQQILSLLRVGSPRYVIFAYGQSLKPADHSIVQSGPFFGMCTNYAITGEVASRTILRVDNPPIPGRGLPSPQAVVESFNVLPPE